MTSYAACLCSVAGCVPLQYLGVLFLQASDFGREVYESVYPAITTKLLTMYRVSAQRCLRGRRLYLLGDSYIRELFFGMIELLTGVRSGPGVACSGEVAVPRFVRRNAGFITA